MKIAHAPRPLPRAVLFTVFALLMMLVATLFGAAEADAKKRGKNITVMSKNVYLGADLSPALLAPTLAEAVDGAGEIYREIERTNFPERAVPLAREIVKSKADLIGLQEVALWREQIPSDGGNPSTTGLGTDATEVKYDFLELLMDEVKKQGGKYRVVATQDEFEGELPADIDNSNETGGFEGADLDARLTMRDVVLAKKGKVKTKRIRMENFETAFESTVGGAVTVRADRGWISLNAKIGKAKFRFLNTHLEAFGDPKIREAQAKELFAKGGPLRTNKQVVMVGDLNSGTKKRHKIFGQDQLAFKALKRFGLEDRGAVQTCCFPSALDDPAFTFDHTVDHVLVKPKVKGLKAKVTGDDPSQMTPSGLWPSDHGGVISKLRLTNIRFK